METLLRKYGLIENLTLQLDIDKRTFARKLADNVDVGGLGAFSGAFEALESSKNDYKGEVTNHGFKIRRRKTFFHYNGIALPVITGTFKKDQDKLVIAAEIKSNTRFLIPLLVGAVIFYLFFISIFLFSSDEGMNGMILFFVPFIALHMGLMLFLPYYLMKKGVATMKKNLKKDFFYFAHGDSMDQSW